MNRCSIRSCREDRYGFRALEGYVVLLRPTSRSICGPGQPQLRYSAWCSMDRSTLVAAGRQSCCNRACAAVRSTVCTWLDVGRICADLRTENFRPGFLYGPAAGHRDLWGCGWLPIYWYFSMLTRGSGAVNDALPSLRDRRRRGRSLAVAGAKARSYAICGGTNQRWRDEMIGARPCCLPRSVRIFGFLSRFRAVVRKAACPWRSRPLGPKAFTVWFPSTRLQISG